TVMPKQTKLEMRRFFIMNVFRFIRFYWMHTRLLLSTVVALFIIFHGEDYTAQQLKRPHKKSEKQT
ncbi:hypothetical protein, partial [Spongiibacter sp.]|uniref:hypothetical protein n=1 Tax=Spongiibacter sp. TaxID=2024860 RepID=UPI0035644F3C